MANNRKRIAARTSFVLLTTLALINSSCTITSYSPVEPTRQSQIETHDKREFLSFSYIPESRDNSESNPQSLPLQSQLLKDLLEQQSRFIKIIVTSSPPAIGTHVNVYQSVNHPSSPWCTASRWTWGVIPCYFDSILYENHFDVFVNNILKQSYRYPIRQEGISWIGLLPFFWINFMTAQYKDAFSGNTAQFIADAKRDGFL